jgi:hypothetical protein
MKGAGMKTSEMLDAIADAAREESVEAGRKMTTAIEGGDALTGGIMYAATAEALLAVMRIMRAAAAKERAEEESKKGE